jgi:acylphosphatase
MPTMKITITGFVYHSGFRYFVKQLASLHELTGTVVYNADRTVEILASGNENDLYGFLKQCRLWDNQNGIEKLSYVNVPEIDFDSFEVVDEGTFQR